MKMTEKNILREIARLLAELDVATYGDDNHKCRTIPPSASRFYLFTMQIFKFVDELVAEHQPDYISNSYYYYICDCERRFKLELEVLKDRKSSNDQSVTWDLEPYLDQMNDLFKSILDKEAQTLSRRE